MRIMEIRSALCTALLLLAAMPSHATSPALEATYAGTSAGARVYNLCGNTPNIALLHNEHTGPSDGVVCIASCNDGTGINNYGGAAVIAVNHLGLGWSSAAVTQIESWLNAP